MKTYALIIDNALTATDNLPTGARRLDTGEWVTPPDGQWPTDMLAACGWHEVTETPEPEPVAGGLWESAVIVVDGLPVRVWTWREWTAEELAWQAEAEARLDDYGQRLTRIEAHLWPAPPDPTTPTDAPEWTEGFIWPSEGLLREGDVVYRNVSGVPLTERPSKFPGTIDQWEHLFVVVLAPDPTPDPQWPQWVQPVPGSGTNEPYPKGAKVTHNGQTWTSDVGGNVWEPGVYGWTLVPQ